MHMSRSVRRGLVVAAAAAGLLALGVGGASADEPLPGTTTGAGGSARGAVQHTLNCAVYSAVKNPVNNTVSNTPKNTGSIAKHDEKTGDCVRDGVRDGAGKAARHVTQATGEAVSEAAAATAHQDLGAVSRFAAPAAPSSAPGLPEDLVIEIPEIVPGVPSIGVIPSSIPQLPVTPGVPAL